MTQTSKSKSRYRISKPGAIEAVSFTDGMLVTAEDLNAAMHYPLSVVQVLLKSYFGCGIVCGLEVSDPNRDRSSQLGHAAAAPSQLGTEIEHQPTRGFIVEIGQGVALGCDNYPIELCEAVRLDLSPDPCGCPIEAEIVKFIAIRREVAPESPSRGCGCGPAASDAGQQCSRVRDHVVVEAFDRMPDGICMEAPVQQGKVEAGPESAGACACLKHCRRCDSCAEPWVLLATVKVDKNGLVPEGINQGEDVRDHGGPAYVKPIACVCANESQWARRYDELLGRVGKLETSHAAHPAVPPSPPPPAPPPPPPPPAPPPPPPPPDRTHGLEPGGTLVGLPDRVRDELIDTINIRGEAMPEELPDRVREALIGTITDFRPGMALEALPDRVTTVLVDTIGDRLPIEAREDLVVRVRDDIANRLQNNLGFQTLAARSVAPAMEAPAMEALAVEAPAARGAVVAQPQAKAAKISTKPGAKTKG